LKILQVAPFFPPHVGGIEHYVADLSERLVGAGHEVTVYTSNVPKSKKYEVVNGVKIHRFNSCFSIFNNHFVPSYLTELIKKNDFDIIHAHGYLHFSTNVVGLLKKIKGYRMVLTIHGSSVGYSGWKGIIEKTYNKTFGVLTLNSADKIIALTPDEAAILEKLGADSKKIAIIPPGIDLSRTSLQNGDDFRREYGLKDKNIILFVGGFIQRKGIHYLIEAMKNVETDSIVLIAGGEIKGHPRVKEALEKQVEELGLREKVIFLGNLGRKEVEKAYNSADIFVLPSIAEGLPLVILEAMAHKKCVIATNIPGNSHVIRDGQNGLLFEKGNTKQLAELIDYLLKNQEIREELAKTARKDIEKKYSSEIILNQVLDLYEGI